MMTIGDRVRAERKQKGWSQEALASRAGVSQGTIGNLESHSRGGAYDTIKAVSHALGVNDTWLRSGDGPKYAAGTQEASNVSEGPHMRGRVPLISWVRAGNWDTAYDPLEPGDAEDWLFCNSSHGPNTYALRVEGDSMTSPYGRSYPHGCIIFVDPSRRSPDNGARIIAKLEGTDEVTFKQFVQEGSRTYLKPLNPQHLPITEPFKVLGTVLGKWEPD
ncbi:MAG: XRE family transcriptional regulator [Abyssibacter sp.]|uniref:LexA family protein n=1 Tax=Abyssibacter sp. TaxID=2320200 RepID=UPI0032198B21